MRSANADDYLTHPDKILWPAVGPSPAVSKRDLADYFDSIGDWMLAHVRGRPCSLVRAPDGIEGQHFFQRHAATGRDRALGTLQLKGDRKAYLTVDSPQALRAIAQMAGVELHPGNGLPGRPEVPGRLVFDLDPGPDVPFRQVVEAALELHRRLSDLGLSGFCKTTGGKGLHVVVPLAADSPRAKAPDWGSAKLFAQTLCAQMASDQPQRYVMTMAETARTGRIFLDYLRNDRLATAVAPLSPRARPGATVSMPLKWSQVRAGLDPKKFTLWSAPQYLHASHPWPDYARSGRSLIAAARALLKSTSQNTG